MTSGLSYKNGSLVRERMRDEVAGGAWDSFNSLLGETPRGNFGNIGKGGGGGLNGNGAIFIIFMGCSASDRWYWQYRSENLEI
jgi:hypothetical protein